MLLYGKIGGGRGVSSGGSFRGIAKAPQIYKPNSSYIQYKNGKKFQKRWYNNDGKPKIDKDYTNHGNAKKHPVTPHYHEWSDGKHGDGF